MTLPFPEPTGRPAPRAEVFLGYLDYFRSLGVSKVQGLSDDQLRMSVLPSGWAVLELVKRLYATKRGERPLIGVAGAACHWTVRQSTPAASSSRSR